MYYLISLKKINAICIPNQHQKLCIFLFRECFFFLSSRANKTNSSFYDGILSTECFLAWLFQVTVTSHRGFHTRQLVTVTGDLL